jgi:hypothetical protein
MYDKLIKILTYVTMGWFFFVVVLMMKQYGLVPWPWRYAWVWQAFGQCGYFIVLCSVGWTWGEWTNFNIPHSKYFLPPNLFVPVCFRGQPCGNADFLSVFIFYVYCG